MITQTLEQKHEKLINQLNGKVGQVVTVKYSTSCCSGSYTSRTGTLVNVVELPFWVRKSDGCRFDNSYVSLMYNGRKNPQQIDFDQIILIKCSKGV